MNSNNKVKRKRNRKALSCTQCQTRKIKCDRNVPHCNSCIIRGIESGCRWGDERDEEIEINNGNKTKRGSQSQQQQDIQDSRESESESSSSRSDSEESEMYSRRQNNKKKSSQKRRAGDEVGLIVETVLKKLKKNKKYSSITPSDSEDDLDSNSDNDDKIYSSIKRKSSSSSKSKSKSRRNSNLNESLRELLYFDLAPVPNPVARKLKMTAFGGFMESNPFFPAPFEQDTKVNVEIVAKSLTRLPNRKVVKLLIDVYMREMEPIRALFNRALWNQQMEEFWKDYDTLQITPNTFPTKNETGLPDHISEEFYVRQTDGNEKYKELAICNIPNQSMIAVIFTLCEQGARFSNLERLLQLGCISSSEITDEEIMEGCEVFSKAAQFHYKLSESVPLPTLWSLQYLFMNDFLAANLAHPSRGAPSDVKKGYAQYAKRNTTAISMAVTMGLNRLGNGYDDAYNTIAEQELGRKKPKDESENIEHDGFSSNANFSQSDRLAIHTTMRFGSWAAEFEDNLITRELARKLWSNMVTMDCFISNHLNQYFIIHDHVDFTAPPAPIDDHDLLLPHAADLVIQSDAGSEIPKSNAIISFSAAFAKISRYKVMLESRKGTPLPYSDILKIDDKYREIMDKLPGYLRLPALSEKGRLAAESMKKRAKKNIEKNDELQSEERFYILQRSILNDQAYFRLLHAHRLHLGKGFKDPRFRRSTLSCLEAAYSIYEARKDLEDAGSLIQHAAFLQSHLVHSALTFQLVLLHEMERWKIAKESYNGPTGKFVYTHELADIDETLAKLNKCLSYLQPRASNMKKLQEFMPGLESFLRGANVRRAAQLQELRSDINQDGVQKKNGSNKIRKRRSDIPSTVTHIEQTNTNYKNDAAWPNNSLGPLIPNGTSPKQFSSGRVSGIYENNGSIPSTSNSQYSINTNAGLPGNSWQNAMYNSREASSVDTSSGTTERSTTTNFSNPYPNSISSASFVDASPSDVQTPSVDVLDPTLWSLDMLFPNYHDAGIDLMAALERELLVGGSSVGEQSWQRNVGNPTTTNFPNISFPTTNTSQSTYPNTQTQQIFHQL